MAIAALALLASVGWARRPIDRSRLFPVSFTYGAGYVNQEGEVALRGDWDYTHDFDAEGMAWVNQPIGNKQHLQGFIDRTGREVFPIEWENVWDFDPRSGLAKVELADDCQYGFIDRTGKVIIPPTWDSAQDFDDSGLACVSEDDQYGFIDRTGKVVIPIEYLYAEPFGSQELAEVRQWNDQADKWLSGFVNRLGEIVIPIEWDDVQDFGPHGLAPVERDGKWGFIDKTGRVVLPLEWAHVWDFSEAGLAAVERGWVSGYIDLTGKIEIPLQWDDACGFHEDGLARVETNELAGYIDRTGKVVVPLEWDWSSWSFEPCGLALVDRDDSYGMIDRTGRVVIDCVWDRIEMVADGDRSMVRATKECPIPVAWLQQSKAWLSRRLGFEFQEPTLCHLYDVEGRLVWSSDWIGDRWCRYVIAIAAGLLAVDFWRLFRERKHS